MIEWLSLVISGWDDTEVSASATSNAETANHLAEGVDRDWVAEAVRRIEADFNRSADTHLLELALPRLGKARSAFAAALRIAKVGQRGRVYRVCCPINNHYSIALMVTDLIVYGSHDGRRRLAGSDLELSG